MKLKSQFDDIEQENVGRGMSNTDGIFVSFGNKLVDLLAGDGAGPLGHILQVYGGSSSGKTWLATEVCYQGVKLYGKKMHLRYLNKEGGNLFDLQNMYGGDFLAGKFAEEINTIQEMSLDILSWSKEIGKDEYGIYVVDSLDSLGTDEEEKEFSERLKKFEKGEEYEKGTYGVEKAKFLSKFFRNIVGTLQEKNILLIIISQVRDNINASIYQKKTQVSGGHAPTFYATQRIEVSEAESIEKEGRKIGQVVQLDFVKTRCKYPRRKLFVSFLGSIGLDDVATNVDYIFDLRDERGKSKDASTLNNIKLKEDGVELTSDNLKSFLMELGKYDEVIEAIRGEGARATQKNIIEYILKEPTLQKEYVEYFGVMDRESVIQYIINNNMEEEIAERAKRKYIEIEERIQPIRKMKTLEL